MEMNMWIREVRALKQQMAEFEQAVKGDGWISVYFVGSSMSGGHLTYKRGAMDYAGERDFKSLPDATRIVRQLVEDATRTRCPKCKLPIIVERRQKRCPSLVCKWKED